MNARAALFFAVFLLSCCRSAPEPSNIAEAPLEGTSGPAPLTFSGLKYADGLKPELAAQVKKALVMRVKEVVGVGREGEIAISGLPIPRNLNVSDPARFSITDAKGNPLPAEMQVLARWDAALADKAAPIQWLRVAVPVSIAGNTTAELRLVVDGPKATFPRPIEVVKKDGGFLVHTGAAQFLIGPEALFKGISGPDGKMIVSPSKMSARINGAEHTFKQAREIEIERQGPLTATIIVRGTTSANAGGAAVAFTRRYVFRAGSPTATVKEVLTWEGEFCPFDNIACNGKPNGLKLDRWRHVLPVNLGKKRNVLVAADFDGTLSAPIKIGETALIAQTQRADRLQKAKYRAVVPGKEKIDELATAGILSLEDGEKHVTVALNHMHRMEPQALSVLEDGTIAVDFASEHVWLGPRSSLYSELAVTAAAGTADRDRANSVTWAPLNYPLRPWPTAEWWSISGTVDRFPVGPLDGGLEKYDSLMLSTLSTTFDYVLEKGVYGLMVHGSFPRYWSQMNGDELDCDADPTPAEKWDDSYWCGTWTDYHSASFNAALYAMRHAEPEWVNELVVPAALRMLHTQVLHCGPNDPMPWCGMGVAGYHAFRSDNNGSHQYWDSLYLYYWLTGDSLVIDTILPGAKLYRAWSCSQRGKGGPACKSADGPKDEGWSDRSGAQWSAAYRFLGLAGDDPSWLEDYRGNISRLITQKYLELEDKEKKGKYGFWIANVEVLDKPRAIWTSQLWMASLYDMRMVDRLRLDTNDAPAGTPPIKPSEVMKNWARTLRDYGAQVGDGSANGRWSNSLIVNWSGARVGGKIEKVEHANDPGDPFLYGTGKACLTWVMADAAARANDAELKKAAIDLTCFSLRDYGTKNEPLGKVSALYLSRLHGAVGVLAEQGWDCN